MKTDANQSKQLSSSDNSKLILYIVLGIAGFIVCLLLLLTIIVVKWKKSKEKSKMEAKKEEIPPANHCKFILKF